MPKAFGLPVTAWPCEDQIAWEKGTATDDFFAEGASASHWRPKSRQQVRYAYGRWLAFLREHYPDAFPVTGSARVTIERTRVYVDHLAERLTAMSVAAELHHLRLALKVLAPDADWTWLGQWQYRWQRAARPRDRRRQMIDPRRLVTLSIELMETAGEIGSLIEGARQFRDGLLIAILITLALRRRSLESLRIDRQIQRVGDHYAVVLDRDDTKTGEPVEFDVPPWLTPYVSRYLSEYRPRFPKASDQAPLWLSTKGGMLGADAIYDVVCRRTTAAFGISIHPHLFRAIAATAFAREAPEKIAVAGDFLTHANLETMHYYRQAQTVEASREHAAVIARIRAGNTR